MHKFPIQKLIFIHVKKMCIFASEKTKHLNTNELICHDFAKKTTLAGHI